MVSVEFYVDEFKHVLNELLDKYEFPRRKRKIKNELWRYYTGKYDMIYFSFGWIRNIAHLVTSFIDRENKILVSLNIMYIPQKLAKRRLNNTKLKELPVAGLKAIGKVIE